MRCCCHTCFIGQLSGHIVVEHDITVDSVNCCVFTFQWNISMAIKKTGLLLRQLLCRCPDHRSAGGTSENEHHHQHLISRDGICRWEKNVCKVACQLVPFTQSISEHFWIMKTVHVDSIVLWLCQTVEDAAQLFNNTVTQNAKQTQDWGQPDNLLDSVRARLSAAPEASVMKRNLHTGNLSLWTQHLSPDSFKVTEEGKGRPSYAKTHSRSSFVVLNGGGQFW